MNNSTRQGLIGALVTFALVFFYLWNSWDIVFPTEVGIDFDMIRYKLGKPFPPGRHWIGLAHRFISLPTKLNTIDFTNLPSTYRRGGPLHSRTKDGLPVLLEVSLQYRLNDTQVVDMYKKFGPNYEKVFVLASIETVTREATYHNATIFFQRRAWLSDKMLDRMHADFQKNYFANISFFQLRSVTLPDVFEQEIQNTEVQKQDIKKALAERGHQEVNGTTRVLVAQQTAKVIELRANASARTVQLNNERYVEQYQLTQQLQAEAFKDIYGLIGNSQDLLVEYLNVRALRDHPSSASVVSIPLST